MNATAQHLAGCETCHQQFTLMLRSRRSSAPLKFTLAPEYWFRHEHLDYEQLVGLADNALDTTDREIIDIHLKVCASCKEDVRSFLAFREQMEQEMGVSIAPRGTTAARRVISIALVARSSLETNLRRSRRSPWNRFSYRSGILCETEGR